LQIPIPDHFGTVLVGVNGNVDPEDSDASETHSTWKYIGKTEYDACLHNDVIGSHEARIPENEAKNSEGRGQLLWGRGQTIWPWGRR